MKIRALFGFLLLLVLLVFFFPACQPPEEEEKPEPVTVEERVAKFLTALNEDDNRDSIYTHLHPDIRNAWKDPELWANTPFTFEDAAFDLEGMEYGTNSADGTFRSQNVIYDEEPIHFHMDVEEEDVWYIERITLTDVEWIPSPPEI